MYAIIYKRTLSEDAWFSYWFYTPIKGGSPHYITTKYAMSEMI